MSRVQRMATGVVVERRDIDNPWQDHEWSPVAVIPGAPPVGEWRVLNRGEGWVHYHAATLDLELHPRETEGYKVNLADDRPLVFVVLRPDEDGDHEVVPFLVTACPFEAGDYEESGDEIVLGVAMPDSMIAWVDAFVEEHHVEVPFKKRRRKPYDPRRGDLRRAGGDEADDV
jgi:hypothetical protein